MTLHELEEALITYPQRIVEAHRRVVMAQSAIDQILYSDLEGTSTKEAISLTKHQLDSAQLEYEHAAAIKEMDARMHPLELGLGKITEATIEAYLKADEELYAQRVHILALKEQLATEKNAVEPNEVLQQEHQQLLQERNEAELEETRLQAELHMYTLLKDILLAKEKHS